MLMRREGGITKGMRRRAQEITKESIITMSGIMIMIAEMTGIVIAIAIIAMTEITAIMEIRDVKFTTYIITNMIVTATMLLW